jgi:hypothetical protein
MVGQVNHTWAARIPQRQVTRHDLLNSVGMARLADADHPNAPANLCAFFALGFEDPAIGADRVGQVENGPQVWTGAVHPLTV